jgi:putative ABC transport system permease protein
MISLALAGLRHRLAAFVATFLAVLVGSALLIACGGLFETAIRLSAEPQRLAGAPILVTGPAGFKLPDEESETVPYAERSTVDRDAVAHVPGVAAAVPDVSFPAVLPGAETDIVLAGHDWVSARLTPYTLRAGDRPDEGEVVLDTATAGRAHVTPGDDVALIVAGVRRVFRVSGVADGPVTAMFFATADARRFTPHPDRADVIGVFPKPGVSAADLRLPAGLTVLTGDDRGAAEFTGVDGSRLPLILLAAIFGGMVMIVMGLVVWATISLSVRQRQRELALLRATGATPDQVRALVVRETMAVSVLACAGGAVLGVLVGGWIFDASVAKGIVPAALRFRQGPVPFAAGVLLGLLVPWLTARLAAGAAAKTSPVQALVEASIPPVTVHPVRRLAALVFAGATVVLALTSMFLDVDTASAIGGPAVLTGAVAVALWGPELVVWLVGRVRPRSVTGEMAVGNVRARATQLAAVLTPITLAVAIALGNVYSQTTMDDEALTTSVDQFEADAVLSSSAGGIAPAVLSKARAVATASALVLSRGWWRSRTTRRAATRPRSSASPTARCWRPRCRPARSGTCVATRSRWTRTRRTTWASASVRG